MRKVYCDACGTHSSMHKDKYLCTKLMGTLIESLLKRHNVGLCGECYNFLQNILLDEFSKLRKAKYNEETKINEKESNV